MPQEYTTGKYCIDHDEFYQINMTTLKSYSTLPLSFRFNNKVHLFNDGMKMKLYDDEDKDREFIRAVVRERRHYKTISEESKEDKSNEETCVLLSQNTFDYVTPPTLNRCGTPTRMNGHPSNWNGEDHRILSVPLPVPIRNRGYIFEHEAVPRLRGFLSPEIMNLSNSVSSTK